MGRYKKIVLPIILFNILCCFGQREVDTLQSKSYDELYDIYNKSSFDKRETLLAIFIKKAKHEKKVEKLMDGYQMASMHYKDERTLFYCDSILSLSTKSNEYDFYSASAYRIKGETYYKRRDFKKELQYYLLSKKHSDRMENSYLTFYINYNIALIKDRLGEHQEALSMHKENLLIASKHLRGKDNQAYLNAIYAIANTYTYLKELDSSSFYNKFGIRESATLKNNNFSNFFTLNQGITHYYSKNYASAIDSLKKASFYFKKIKDLPNQSECYYFLGKSYLSINNVDNAILYYKKIKTFCPLLEKVINTLFLTMRKKVILKSN